MLEAFNCPISPLYPTPSISHKYFNSMLECNAGYPLYEPQPEGGISMEHCRKGVQVGDVGIVTEDGAFDFLFNICSSQKESINPLDLPEDFETLDAPEVSTREHFQPDTCLFNSAVNRTESLSV